LNPRPSDYESPDITAELWARLEQRQHAVEAATLTRRKKSVSNN
jgi:hypothetical protein